VDAAQKARLEVADLIAKLTADRVCPQCGHIASGRDSAEVREAMLVAYLRGQRSEKPLYPDNERTPRVEMIEVDASEMDTSPGRPRSIRRSRVMRRR
jgi:hypothetical protein